MPKPITPVDPNLDPNPSIGTRYDYSSISRPGVDFPKNDPKSRSVTNQSDKDSTDINKIMERYEKTGYITDLLGNARQPMYGDFTAVGDYHQLQDTLAKVNQAFSVLPASVRNQFNNDPANLIAFLSDPKNDAESVKLGLKDESILKQAGAAAGSEAAGPQNLQTTPAGAPATPPPNPTVGQQGGGQTL